MKYTYAIIGIVALVIGYFVYDRFLGRGDADVEKFRSKKSKKWGYLKCHRYKTGSVKSANARLSGLTKFTKDNRNKYHPRWGEAYDRRIKGAQKVVDRVNKTYKDNC